MHRDIKIEDFRIHENLVRLTDFSDAFEYIVNGQHIPFEKEIPMKADPLTSTIHGHVGHQLSRRDDLISMSYAILLLSMKSLPWSDEYDELENAVKTKPILDKIRKKKMEIEVE